MKYSNLIAGYTSALNSHANSRAGTKVNCLTPHYMAGNMGAKACAEYHTRVEASANYYIGADGTIWGGVDETLRPWTSASYSNDCRAITFECANNPDSSLTDACYKALVKLSADICKRYGFTPHYNGGTSGTVTMHKQFAATSCPGTWLSNKITSGQYEKDVLVAMGQKTVSPTTTSTATKKWDQNAVLKVGDEIRSVSCTIGDVQGDLVKVPALGGYVPLDDVTEASDSKDGKVDDYLATQNARVFLDGAKVTKIISSNMVTIKGRSGETYNVLTGSLMAKR